jgi:N utilization substance protein A
VIVNDDQLSLAIGKRGQNVRLAARLTGWDVDILTPPEFQLGVQRLDQTLKGLSMTQEQVDKAIALGLIDVRDIEEVGTGPLMEELGLEAELAEKVVAKCASEAKIVAVEQEAKKAADAKKKAADKAAFEGGPDSRSASADGSVAKPAAAAPTAAVEDDAIETGADHVPDGMEAASGGSPEVTVHDEKSFVSNDELSVEEQAVHGMVNASGSELPDEDANAAASLTDGGVQDA